ncbi:MAG TPA: hypothetical protein VNO43_00840 [Candidatus Eisenbacteria bacterium]|nr:hypothetical protein [Candidatus Eisenbacteria bacterium]
MSEGQDGAVLRHRGGIARTPAIAMLMIRRGMLASVRQAVEKVMDAMGRRGSQEK